MCTVIKCKGCHRILKKGDKNYFDTFKVEREVFQKILKMLLLFKMKITIPKLLVKKYPYDKLTGDNKVSK